MEEALQKTIETVTAKWRQDPFYAPETVALGLDIGMEGIGIAVRKGREIVYCKSLLYSLPEAEALKQRRLLRSARHARKNRKLRMRRLRALFEKHGLPWVGDDIMSRSDPFLLRHRALKTILASKEALSICIRSCVELRGYDYFAMSRHDGEFPWGEDGTLSEARKWVSSQFIDAQMRQALISLAPELTHNKKELTREQTEEWERLVEQRASKADQEGIPAMLQEYAKKHLNERCARRHNYPRAHVEQHLREILERHRHLIEGYDAFIDSLFLPCNSQKNRSKAIFHYNRKTPDEAERHYNSKVKKCPYCEWLDIPVQRCGESNEMEIRRWKLLDFVSNRTFDFSHGKLPMPRTVLPESCIRLLVQAVESKKSWKDVDKELKEVLKPCQFTPKSEWNKAQFEHLKDIVAPPKTARGGRANVSVEAACEMARRATSDGTVYTAASIEAWKKESGLYEQRQRIQAQAGIYPQVRMLLGTLKTKGEDKYRTFATTGQLQRIFEELNASGKLSGKLVPDYCVVECVRNAAINKKQADEISSEQKKNRASREKLVEKFGKMNATRADFLRMRLFSEQQLEKGGPAICPFTGKSLGNDPFSSDLQLAHLFPDSRGGLYVAENLVLTTAEINRDMQNRTPKEAAEACLPGWLSWKDMLMQSSRFNWNSSKRHFFAFESTPEESFPDFNNMTRVAQLAKELRNLVAVWMGISADAEELRSRIGNPCGTYTAAARRGMMPDFVKDRSNNLHHRIDAAVMTCIPPASGINDVRYGGIFYSDKVAGNRYLTCIPELPLPDFAALRRDGAESPILYHQSRSKCQSLGDATFWGVNVDGLTHQRTPLKADTKDSPASLRSTLLKMMTNEKMGSVTDAVKSPKSKRGERRVDLIPSEKQIQRWISDAQAVLKGDGNAIVRPLCLTDGTPIRSYWKFGSKGNVDKSPLGWNGVIKNGVFDQLRSLSASNDRMELWLGWNAKKKCWAYYKRVIPVATALAGLKRMGLPWRGRQNAPEYLIKLLDANGAKDLKEMVCGTLPPHAVKLGQFRKGDVFCLQFARNDAYVEKLKQKDKHFDMLNHQPILLTWGRVSAVKSDGSIENTCLTHKDRKKCVLKDVGKLAVMLGFPEVADEQARSLSLVHPA